MATKLEKDVTRESTVTVDERELLVTLTADQKIAMKPKGLGNGNIVSIGIEDVFKLMKPNEDAETPQVSGNSKKPYSDNLMISVGELRDLVMIADISYENKVIFSNLVRDVIYKHKK